MGIFATVKRTYARAKVIIEVTNLAKTDTVSNSFKPLYNYLLLDEHLSAVIKHHNARRTQLYMAYAYHREFSADAMRAGHLVAAEALLNMDTLSYLIRAENDQVSQREAHAAVLQFLQSGGLVFQPERALRAKEGI